MEQKKSVKNEKFRLNSENLDLTCLAGFKKALSTTKSDYKKKQIEKVWINSKKYEISKQI